MGPRHVKLPIVSWDMEKEEPDEVATTKKKENAMDRRANSRHEKKQKNNLKIEKKRKKYTSAECAPLISGI